MIKDYHKQVKLAIHQAGASSGDFSTEVGGRIYDTVADAGAKTPYVVWSLQDVNVVGHFGDQERLNASVSVMLVTDYTLGMDKHLLILDDLESIRFYSGPAGTTVDKITMVMNSIGAVLVEDRFLVSTTLFSASGTRKPA